MSKLVQCLSVVAVTCMLPSFTLLYLVQFITVCDISKCFLLYLMQLLYHLCTTAQMSEQCFNESHSNQDIFDGNMLTRYRIKIMCNSTSKFSILALEHETPSITLHNFTLPQTEPLDKPHKPWTKPPGKPYPQWNPQTDPLCYPSVQLIPSLKWTCGQTPHPHVNPGRCLV